MFNYKALKINNYESRRAIEKMHTISDFPFQKQKKQSHHTIN